MAATPSASSTIEEFCTAMYEPPPAPTAVDVQINISETPLGETDVDGLKQTSMGVYFLLEKTSGSVVTT